jgi:ribosomal protein S18 acetylase RimI-like enzyme
MRPGRACARHVRAFDRARERGFRAMQFNFVISSNEGAVRLWQSCGFEIVGQLPDAFDHPRLGLVDAFVMYRAVRRRGGVTSF